MKIKIKKTRKGEFRFNLIGDNGEIVATSESYKRRATMKKTLDKYFPNFVITEEWSSKLKVVDEKWNMILPPKTKGAKKKIGISGRELVGAFKRGKKMIKRVS